MDLFDEPERNYTIAPYFVKNINFEIYVKSICSQNQVNVIPYYYSFEQNFTMIVITRTTRLTESVPVSGQDS